MHWSGELTPAGDRTENDGGHSSRLDTHSVVRGEAGRMSRCCGVETRCRGGAGKRYREHDHRRDDEGDYDPVLGHGADEDWRSDTACPQTAGWQSRSLCEPRPRIHQPLGSLVAGRVRGKTTPFPPSTHARKATGACWPVLKRRIVSAEGWEGLRQNDPPKRHSVGV